MTQTHRLTHNCELRIIKQISDEKLRHRVYELHQVIQLERGKMGLKLKSPDTPKYILSNTVYGAQIEKSH